MRNATPALLAGLIHLRQQVEQMRGLFDDTDGTIAAACSDADDAIAKAQLEISGTRRTG